MNEPVPSWLHAEQCKDVVLRFMALFDARAYADMEDCVMPDVEWHRPDRTVRGVLHLREVLAGTPEDIRVRHVITNLRAHIVGEARVTIDSYYTVYRHVGTLDHDCPAPLPVGAASVGRYRDELVLVEDGWKIARKQTFVDFRRP